MSKRQANRSVNDRVRASRSLLGKIDQLVDDQRFPLVVALLASMTPAVRDLSTMGASIERRELLAERADLHRVSMIAGSPDRFSDLPIEPGVEPTVEGELRMSVAARGCSVPASCDAGDVLEVSTLLDIGPPGVGGSEASRGNDRDPRVRNGATPILCVRAGDGGKNEHKKPEMK